MKKDAKVEYKLWENGTPYFNPDFGQPEPTIVPYLTKTTEKRGCVIIFPGGAYKMRAFHEGEPVAKMVNRVGMSAFVVNYRVAPYRHPAELSDALRSIRFVRFNAKKFNIDPEKIVILGFSAGGHLAVSASEHFDYGVPDGDDIDKVSSRPNGAVFCYAVCSFTQYFSHGGSRDNLLGANATSPLVASLSGELNVRSDMPPVFIWHTAEDNSVPVENALTMAIALRQKSVPFEMHIFPTGAHGLGLSKDNTHSAQWTALLKKWLSFYGFNKS